MELEIHQSSANGKVAHPQEPHHPSEKPVIHCISVESHVKVKYSVFSPDTFTSNASPAKCVAVTWHKEAFSLRTGNTFAPWITSACMVPAATGVGSLLKEK